MNSKNISLSIFLSLLALPAVVAAQTQIRNTSDSFRRYGMYGVTAYLSGDGLANVRQLNFSGSDLLAIWKAIDSASKGSIVTIDNLRYIDSNGRTLSVNQLPYDLNKGKIFIPYKSAGELELEKLRTLNFTSGIVYFTGVGFPNIMAINAKDANFLRRCFDKSARGTRITFDNCVSKHQNGTSSAINKSIML